jgi:threonine dehydrogenase-like Zn-dependent dehydrogenase
MRAAVMHGAHDVRVETVPDVRLVEPSDALVRVTRACTCGSDLWPYNSMAPVSERGDAAIERVRELTGGLGAHAVLECVGHGEGMRTAVSVARACRIMIEF